MTDGMTLQLGGKKEKEKNVIAKRIRQRRV